MDTTRADLDREVDVMLSAMRLVATGGARRTVVAGLCAAPEVLAIAAASPDAVGLVLEPLPRRHLPGIDIVVRRRSNGPAELGG